MHDHGPKYKNPNLFFKLIKLNLKLFLVNDFALGNLAAHDHEIESRREQCKGERGHHGGCTRQEQPPGLLEAHVLIERLFGVTRGPYATRWTRVEHVLRAIPVVRWFGHHWVFVLEKRAE